MENKEFKSAFCGYTRFSYLVSWDKKRPGYIETLSKDNALKRCCEMKEEYGAVCYKICCATGEKIERLA